jgi:hypothetical protein
MPKRQRDYAKEYARRLAQAQAAGKSRSEGRGHGVKGGKTESQRRRERELRETGLTSSQRTTITRFAEKRAELLGLDAEEQAENLLNWAAAKGYDQFKAERKFIETMGMEGMTMAELEAQAADGERFPDPKIYWYHPQVEQREARTTRRERGRKGEGARRGRERRQRRKAGRKAA